MGIQPLATFCISAQCPKAKQGSDNEQDQGPPVGLEELAGADKNLGRQGQFLFEAFKHRHDLGSNVNEHERHDQRADHHDEQGVYHRCDHSVFKSFLLLHNIGEPLQYDFECAGRFTRIDHVNVYGGEDIGIFAQRLGKGGAFDNSLFDAGYNFFESGAVGLRDQRIQRRYQWEAGAN